MSDIKKRLEKYGFTSEAYDPDLLDPTVSDFPQSHKRFKVVWETMGLSVEEPYFWMLNLLKEYASRDIIKIRDLFTASETSAFFGSASSRLNIQQDRASQYLGLIGKMLRDLFQVVRELRIIDMRMDMYTKSAKGDKSADMALKGLWVDLVEGGTKNAGSVFGLAREVGFAILPDLFFGTYVKNADEVDSVIKKLTFNEKIKEVLARKLVSYMIWKVHTEKELVARRGFMIRYLRQHHDTIQMYMNWVRPYLNYVKRLSMDQDRLKSPDLITAFEGSMIEIEILVPAGKEKNGYKGYINYHFLYRTRPSMDFHQDGYQHKGPIHVGKVDISIRSFVWNEEEKKKYIKYRNDEDLDLLASIDDSIREAMQLLGDDLKRYIEEAGGKWGPAKDDDKKESKEDKPSLDLFEPFKNLVNGISELVAGKELFDGKTKKKSTPSKSDMKNIKKIKESIATGMIDFPMWKSIEFFKKAHGMLAW